LIVKLVNKPTNNQTLPLTAQRSMDKKYVYSFIY